MTELHIRTFDHGFTYEHAVWTHDAHWTGKEWVGLVEHCGIAHSKVDWDEDVELLLMDYLDCPVASRWALVRSR